MALIGHHTAGSGKGEDEYEEAMKILDHRFTPQINVPFERHEFRQMNQKESETIDQFVIWPARQLTIVNSEKTRRKVFQIKL